jgi:WD40-like Beta Propeller Repeat
MTSNVSFDRDLRAFLDDKAGTQLPDYLAEVLLKTTISRQRKRWSSLQWWLPLDSIRVSGLTTSPAVLRVVLVTLLALALIGVALIAGAFRPPAPPFGPAGNGVLAIANPAAILVADADGRNQRLLIDAPDGVEGLTWSPAGTKLAFRTLSPVTRLPTIMVIDHNGSNLIDATPGLDLAGLDEVISWSPDSTQFVVPSPDAGGGRLIVANADGSGARALALAGGPRSVVSAAWSPDGAWIAFMASVVSSTDVGLHFIRPDGSGERFALPSAPTAQGGAPVWAPDPDIRRLLYVSADGEIVLYDDSIEDGVAVGLADSGMWPSWSPDATQVAWWHEGIFIVNVDSHGLRPGESPRPLMAFGGICPERTRVRTGIACGPPAWSPDGTRIFATDVAGKAIVVLSVDGSQPPITIDLPPGTELNPVNSTSWQRIAQLSP